MNSPPDAVPDATPTRVGPVLVLVAATAAALIWANSPAAPLYVELLGTKVGPSLGALSLNKSVLHWVNDGLMTVFFLVVGLELKRELLEGSLSTVRKASLPAAAALGGMAAPAVLYLVLAPTGTEAGWGVPMATDIAFALGVLALLGNRVPPALKGVLLAFAVVDDLGAVAVIALFYTTSLQGVPLVSAAVAVAVLAALHRARARPLGVYLLVGAFLWLAVLKSGVHATVAGVLLAAFIPHRAPHGDPDDSLLLHLEHALQPWVSWLILPVFALANAGVAIPGADALLHPVALAVGTGLVVGKLVGVPLLAWLAVRLGLAKLPDGVGWGHMIGLGLLGGIGFTMAVFIAGLAFADPAHQDAAKTGILAASAVAATLGVGWLALLGQSAAGASPTRRGTTDASGAGTAPRATAHESVSPVTPGAPTQARGDRQPT